jgi:hypothetical protein
MNGRSGILGQATGKNVQKAVGVEAHSRIFRLST